MMKPLDLVGVDGSPYAPQGSTSGRMWGQRNIDNARFREAVERIQTMGQPGMGFLSTSKYGLPNATWDGFHGLMMGLRDGAAAAGKSLKTGSYGNDIDKPTTRFDPMQVGVTTGQTLGEDQAAFTETLNGNPRPSARLIDDLKRRFGLR